MSVNNAFKLPGGESSFLSASCAAFIKASLSGEPGLVAAHSGELTKFSTARALRLLGISDLSGLRVNVVLDGSRYLEGVNPALYLAISSASAPVRPSILLSSLLSLRSSLPSLVNNPPIFWNTLSLPSSSTPSTFVSSDDTSDLSVSKIDSV